jgi:hypothetical protein
MHTALAKSLARGDRQHAAGQHAEASRVLGHTSQLPHTPRVDVAAPPQLPAVGMRPGGAHACSCVLGAPERAEELGQQVRRQQDIHTPRWERRHLGDEASALFLSSGELSQASTTISRSCAYESLARRTQLMRREGTAAGRPGDRDARNFASSAPHRKADSCFHTEYLTLQADPFRQKPTISRAAASHAPTTQL